MTGIIELSNDDLEQKQKKDAAKGGKTMQSQSNRDKKMQELEAVQEKRDVHSCSIGFGSSVGNAPAR